MTGQKLRILREFRNYSQEYIADKLGITQNAYSRIETNQTKISTERLGKLAIILNIPPVELLSDKEPVIHFVDPYAAPATSTQARNEQLEEKEEYWKQMFEITRQLHKQAVSSKDEKIAYLEDEIHTLRKERDQIIHLVEKLTTGPVSFSFAAS
ncbi:helix-turn-helix domain-containing protein [Flavitalea flava]